MIASPESFAYIVKFIVRLQRILGSTSSLMYTRLALCVMNFIVYTGLVHISMVCLRITFM